MIGQHYINDDAVQEAMSAGCEVLEHISTAAVSLSSCSSGMNAWIVLEIL
jgi:hypothetical protein